MNYLGLWLVLMGILPYIWASERCQDKARWCPKMATGKLSLSRCYNPKHYRRCCLTCQRLQLPIPECPFGDHETWCSELDKSRPIADCYAHNKTCCQTCHLYDSGIATCAYGDKATWCSGIGTRYSISSCYDNHIPCCGTCAQYKTGIPGCEYGDKLTWCSSIGTAFSKQHCDTSSDVCCKTCHMIQEADNIVLPGMNVSHVSAPVPESTVKSSSITVLSTPSTTTYPTNTPTTTSTTSVLNNQHRTNTTTPLHRHISSSITPTVTSRSTTEDTSPYSVIRIIIDRVRTTPSPKVRSDSNHNGPGGDEVNSLNSHEESHNTAIDSSGVGGHQGSSHGGQYRPGSGSVSDPDSAPATENTLGVAPGKTDRNSSQWHSERAVNGSGDGKTPVENVVNEGEEKRTEGGQAGTLTKDKPSTGTQPICSLFLSIIPILVTLIISRQHYNTECVGVER